MDKTISVVKTFNYKDFTIEWINAVTKYGYIRISKNPSSERFKFVDAWLLAGEIDKFLRNEPKILAEDVACHLFSYEPIGPRLNIFPRYSGDYQDNNQTYNIVESDVQPETSTETIILPLVDLLAEYLAKL